jgi:hypothetical protein
VPARGRVVAIHQPGARSSQAPPTSLLARQLVDPVDDRDDPAAPGRQLFQRGIRAPLKHDGEFPRAPPHSYAESIERWLLQPLLEDVRDLALGFTGLDTATLVGELGVALDARGNLAVDAGYATSVPGVYGAGDAHRGASLIVWAIAEGRELARSIDAALRGERSSLPARGQDLAF